MKLQSFVAPILMIVTVVSFVSFIAFLELTQKADRHFWYPISLVSANCLTFKGEVYLMDNSIGWRSWPYFLEVSTKKEITLGVDCTFRNIKKLPKHKRQVQDKLTDEQKQYLIEGF